MASSTATTLAAVVAVVACIATAPEGLAPVWAGGRNAVTTHVARFQGSPTRAIGSRGGPRPPPQRQLEAHEPFVGAGAVALASVVPL